MNRISGVYKITNTVTGDFYIGSSKNVKDRWVSHKCLSTWKRYTNSPLYQDMQKYGVDKFRFQILAPVMEEHLKQVEQEYIKMLRPTYNSNNAKGLNIERRKKTNKKYQQSEKGKKTNKKYQQSEKGKKTKKEYLQSEKGKEALREYKQSYKGREVNKKAVKKYYSQLCVYNGETLTLNALRHRFRRAGIPHPTVEAKKYLCQVEKQ